MVHGWLPAVTSPRDSAQYVRRTRLLIRAWLWFPHRHIQLLCSNASCVSTLANLPSRSRAAAGGLRTRRARPRPVAPAVAPRPSAPAAPSAPQRTARSALRCTIRFARRLRSHRPSLSPRAGRRFPRRPPPARWRRVAASAVASVRESRTLTSRQAWPARTLPTSAHRRTRTLTAG